MKKWISRIIRSKTMLFNILLATGAALEGVTGVLQTVLPGNVFAWFTVALTVGNAVLRIVTTQPLTDK